MFPATLALFFALSPSASGRVAYLVDQLTQAGFSQTEAQALLHNRRLRMYPLKKVSPHQIDWGQFIARLVTPSSIGRGREFLERNHDALTAAEQRFGVDKETLSALVRVETNFGRNTGKFVTFNVYYTELVQDEEEKRWKFAAENLVSLASYCKRMHRDCFGIKGSYAGAIGLAQFLPHTLEQFGVDGDGDGIVDAFQPADAIFSAANFLVEHGWRDDKTEALGKYYGSPEGYPRAVLAYADTLRQ